MTRLLQLWRTHDLVVEKAGFFRTVAEVDPGDVLNIWRRGGGTVTVVVGVGGLPGIGIPRILRSVRRGPTKGASEGASGGDLAFPGLFP